MNIHLVEVSNQNGEMFFNIFDSDIDENIGILFTVGDNVAYEIKEEFRGKGAATEALKKSLEKIKKPKLEITFYNIPSMKVAKKAGFKLIRTEGDFCIYIHPDRGENQSISSYNYLVHNLL